MYIPVKRAPFAITLILLTSSYARAADAVSEPITPQQGEWVLTVAPYVWAAGLQGDVGLFGRQPVDIDMSFGDIFDNLRFGGMVVGEAHNGTWGILADIAYLKMEVEQMVERSVLGVPLALSGNILTSSFTGTIMGQYRAIEAPSATLDVMAGPRIWSVDNDISLSLTAGGEPIVGLSGSDGDTWVDPIVGVKSRIDLNPFWYLTGWGMVGGFGAVSDLDWDVLGGVGYQWTDRISIVGGYRALGVDYENDGFVFDTTQHGPIVGAVFRF